MSAPERYEQVMAFLAANLPARVEQQEEKDGLVFTAGDPPEVVVRLTQSHVIVSEYAAVWGTPFTLVARPRRVGVLNWKRLPETAFFNALSQLIRGAREVRLSRFRTCRHCGESSPPEWLHSDDVCHGCAERSLGFVH
jgi:hypothetical protein